jgi:DNA repair exonuclease SbcCD ATPase subunit
MSFQGITGFAAFLTFLGILLAVAIIRPPIFQELLSTSSSNEIEQDMGKDIAGSEADEGDNEQESVPSFEELLVMKKDLEDKEAELQAKIEELEADKEELLKQEQDFQKEKEKLSQEWEDLEAERESFAQENEQLELERKMIAEEKARLSSWEKRLEDQQAELERFQNWVFGLLGGNIIITGFSLWGWIKEGPKKPDQPSAVIYSPQRNERRQKIQSPHQKQRKRKATPVFMEGNGKSKSFQTWR